MATFDDFWAKRPRGENNMLDNEAEQLANELNALCAKYERIGPAIILGLRQFAAMLSSYK